MKFFLAEKKKLKLGFISDLHLNEVFGGDKLDYALKKFQEAQVEVVIIGGDFIDYDSNQIEEGITKITYLN